MKCFIRLNILISTLLMVCNLHSQTIDLNLKFDQNEHKFIVSVKTDYQGGDLFIGPSQITILIPGDASGEHLNVLSLANPLWYNNSSIYSPAALPGYNFHAIATTGAKIELESGKWVDLFSFEISNVDCLAEGVRFFYNGKDPSSREPGMQGGDFGNSVNGIFLNSGLSIEMALLNQDNVLPSIELTKQAPIAICDQEVIILNLNESRCVSLDAFYLDKGSFDNCTPTEELKFSFSSDVMNKNKTLCCMNIGLNSVEMYVTDNEGLYSVCTANIKLLDPLNECSNPVLSGRVIREDEEFVDGVEIVLKDNWGNVFESTVNEEINGQFYLFNATYNNDFSLALDKTDFPLNGVSTYDLYLLERHLHNIEPLYSELTYIAADVNLDGFVDQNDSEEIRSLILGSQLNFPAGPSWRFGKVKGETVLFEKDGYSSLNVLLEHTPIEDISIMAVKLGDLDLDAIPNQRFDKDYPFDNLESLDLQVNIVRTDSFFYAADFYSPNFNEIKGFQFTLAFSFDHFTFLNFTSGQISLDDSNFGFHSVEEGLITMSWNSLQPKSLNPDLPVFSLKFRSEKPIEDMTCPGCFNLSDYPTITEAYTSKARKMPVTLIPKILSFAQNYSNKNYQLFQNVPNPFSGYTNIDFQIPYDTYVTFKIFDLSGRLIKIVSDDYKEGRNTILIDEKVISHPGTYFYHMITDDFKAVKKMIIVR